MDCQLCGRLCKKPICSVCYSKMDYTFDWAFRDWVDGVDRRQPEESDRQPEVSTSSGDDE